MNNFPEKLDMLSVLKKAVPLFDGGFHFGGITGNGDSFVMRDAHGIRHAYYYINEDVIVAASERAAIRTAFNLEENEVHELLPGNGIDCKSRW
jgi:amidophosphoribosyltransferase